MTRRSYLVIGCGRFGSQAVQKLLRQNPRSKIVVVDIREKAFRAISSFPAEAIVDDGTAYLGRALSKGEKIDYIIPAVPFHLAFEFILSQSSPLGARRAEIPPLHGLPNLMVGERGDVYSSLADFLCPGDCPEPPGYCTVTRKKRPRPLYNILADLDGPFETQVIRSRQLGPGVGGLDVKELLSVAEDVKKGRPAGHLILISTACRCHGVTSALMF
jgi:threonine dehydrogenase-like Zn-dependent dehydrogenase